MGGKGTSIQVAVLALTHGQHSAVQPGTLQALVLGATGAYDVTKKGLVYGDSRDDWCPYEDGVTIVKHLEDAGCDVVALSPYVDDDDLRGDLLSQVDLYLFDPLFLTDPKYATLVLQLDAAIRKGEQTGVSVLLPKRIPSAVRDELEVICHAKLPLTADGYGKGRGQWLASSVMDLRSYVSR